MVNQFYGQPKLNYFYYMANFDTLKSFQKIKIRPPYDKIIWQVGKMITAKPLNPGDKFLPDKKLSEKLGMVELASMISN